MDNLPELNDLTDNGDEADSTPSETEKDAYTPSNEEQNENKPKTPQKTPKGNRGGRKNQTAKDVYVPITSFDANFDVCTDAPPSDDTMWVEVSQEVEISSEPNLAERNTRSSLPASTTTTRRSRPSIDSRKTSTTRRKSRGHAASRPPKKRKGKTKVHARKNVTKKKGRQSNATKTRNRSSRITAVQRSFGFMRPRSAFLRANEALKDWNSRFSVIDGTGNVLHQAAETQIIFMEISEHGDDDAPRFCHLSTNENGFGEGSRNSRDSEVLKMSLSYVLNRICEDVQHQDIAGKPKEDEIDWTVNAEVLFFYALMGHKPVGVNRHFMMLLIHNKFSNYVNREISSKVLWDKLDTMYDMSALHESEIIPFPNDEVDFELPEDCHDLLYSEYGVRLEKSSSENDVNKNSASSSKSIKKLTTKLKQSTVLTSTPKNNFTSPVLNKPLKNQSTVKNETKSSDVTPKVKQEPVSSSKANKIKRSSSPFSNKTVKSESSSVMKEDSPDIPNKKSNKLERGNSPAVLKKPIKVEPAVTSSTSKKPAKSESSSNGSKLVKSEVADSSVKKIKSDKDLTSKKGKMTSSPADMPTKKPKVDVTSVKKKSENDSSSRKNSESSSVKQIKGELKSSSHSSKGQETGTPPPSGSRKSSPVVKIKGNESAKKMKRHKIEENSKKSASKRRRQ